MFVRITHLVTGVALLGMSALAGATTLPAHAGQVSPPPGPSSLQLSVDKPIVHLGERVLLSGRHFTPGATVALYLHGPMSATLGGVYARTVVDPRGSFTVSLRVADYPDQAARQWHTVVLAALSSALVDGTREGAAVAVQADPMPSIEVTTRAALARTSLTIDGTEVRTVVSARSATRYRIAYAGHLRAGLHSAYLKWSDASGAYGTRLLSFRTGSPYADTAAPSLNLSAYHLRLGDQLGVAGSHFTPGATVAVTLGGPNTPPSRRVVGRARVDAAGQFHLVMLLTGYPDANARRSGIIEVSVTASGAAVGDLPEAVTVPVAVAR